MKPFKALFLTIIVFTILLPKNSNTQELYIEQQSSTYSFYNNNNLLIPDVDYSKIYIIFNNNVKPGFVQQFKKDFPELFLRSQDKDAFFALDALSFELNKDLVKTIQEAKNLIRRIQNSKNVISVSPYLIRNNDIAVAGNKILIGISKDSDYENTLVEIIGKTNSKLTEAIEYTGSNTFVISCDKPADIFDISREIYRNFDVNFVQPELCFKGNSQHVPNDPYLANQWFIQQNSDADIDAIEAWDITRGSSYTTVAIIDGNGYDMDHQEFALKLTDPYCAVNDNNNPEAVAADENHGTPCAGLIGCQTNNGYGVASVGYNCSVLPVRIGYDFNGGGFTTSSLIIQRAGSHIVNSEQTVVAVSNSIGLGTWANIQSVYDAYNNMRTQCRNGLGAVILASTGNDGQANMEQYPNYFPHVVGVGNSNEYDQRTPSSNYGDSLDIIAPGNSLYTIDRTGNAGYTNDNFVNFSGTSAACPVAAGIVGLMATQFPDYNEQQLRQKLYNACDKAGGYNYTYNPNYPYSTWNNEMGYGRVNAYLAVMGGGTALYPPQNLQAGVNGNNVLLSWDPPSVSGTQEELIYDNNTNTSFYSWIGYTMSTHMSPDGPCQILKLKYYTQGTSYFTAKVFNWLGTEPGTTKIAELNVTAENEEWTEVDVSAYNLNVDNDFVVGFGSVNSECGIGFDDTFNNGRSWDFTETPQSWQSFDETYLIRAVVEYPDGSRETLIGNNIPETVCEGSALIERAEFNNGNSGSKVKPINNYPLRGLIGYNVYRNGTKINGSVLTSTTYADYGLPAGNYSYTVTAYYSEGESQATGPVLATITGGSLPGPENLTANNIEQNVTLAWSAPGGGGSDQWLKYHDGTFENSFASQNGGAGLAQLFNLPSYPATLKEVRFFVTGYNNYNATVEVYILSGNGETVLAGPYTTNGVYNNWITWDVSDFSINQPSFMVATYNPEADGPYVGVDDSQYLSNLYFGNHTSGFTEMGSGEYYYVGSHEALVNVSKESRSEDMVIKPREYNNSRDLSIAESGNNNFVNKKPTKMAGRGLQYYKVYRNNTYIGNTNNTNYSDVLTAYGTFNYYVTAIYDEGESMSSNLATIYYGVGVEENEKSVITIWPNPASDVLYFRSEVIPDRAEIFTSAGACLMVLKHLKKENTIKINHLNNGLYLLKIDFNGKSRSLRFIVNNL